MPLDYRAFVRGGLVDNYSYAEKTRIIARFFGCGYVFPWQSKTLSDYVFNLPASEKFNLNTLTNKILLRRLLSERLQYSRPKRGIDIIDRFTTEMVLEFKMMEAVPKTVVRNIRSNFLVPEGARKRCLMECGLLFSYTHALNIDDSDVLSFLGL